VNEIPKPLLLILQAFFSCSALPRTPRPESYILSRKLFIGPRVADIGPFINIHHSPCGFAYRMRVASVSRTAAIWNAVVVVQSSHLPKLRAGSSSWPYINILEGAVSDKLCRLFEPNFSDLPKEHGLLLLCATGNAELPAVRQRNI
jgi:hypothetical protein